MYNMLWMWLWFQCMSLHSVTIVQSLEQHIQYIALKSQNWSISVCMDRWNFMSSDWPVPQSFTASVLKAKASVVIMLHLRPAGDPILFLRLFRLKSQIELIALGLAYFHPLVLWHYPVVDGSLEEPEQNAPLVSAPHHRSVSSLRWASLFQRAGSSSLLSGLWPHTSLSCWLSRRSRTSTLLL